MSVWNGTFTMAEMKNIYMNSHVWVAPTELEGFHNVAAEASLCGNIIVCNKRNSNGMGDYADDETAMRYDNVDQIIPMIKHPNPDCYWKMRDVLFTKIGDREKNMKILIETLSR
jgi:hypothetical protein